jgi:hypothetical protein
MRDIQVGEAPPLDERANFVRLGDVIDAMAVKYTGEPFPFRPQTGILCVLDVESAKVRLLPFRHV